MDISIWNFPDASMKKWTFQRTATKLSEAAPPIRHTTEFQLILELRWFSKKFGCQDSRKNLHYHYINHDASVTCSVSNKQLTLTGKICVILAITNISVHLKDLSDYDTELEVLYLLRYRCT